MVEFFSFTNVLVEYLIARLCTDIPWLSTLHIEVAEQEEDGEDKTRNTNKKAEPKLPEKRDAPETGSAGGEPDRSDSDESDDSIWSWRFWFWLDVFLILNLYRSVVHTLPDFRVCEPLPYLWPSVYINEDGFYIFSCAFVVFIVSWVFLFLFFGGGLQFIILSFLKNKFHLLLEL